MTTATDKQLINQLHRIKGQIDGIERMIDEFRDCGDILMQLMAARSSIEKVALKILSEETNSCLRSKNKKDQARLEKVAQTLFKYT